MTPEKKEPRFCEPQKTVDPNVRAATTRPEKAVKRPRKWAVIVPIALVLVFRTAAFAATPYGSGAIRKVAQGLGVADTQGYVQKNLGSASDRGITATLVAAVAGNEKVILQILYEGVPDADSPCMVESQFDFVLRDEQGNPYSCSNGAEVLYNALIPNPDGSYLEAYEVNAAIRDPQKMTVCISEIAGIPGRWEIPFDMEIGPIYEYRVNQSFEIDGGSILIEKVSIDAFSTVIWFRDQGIDNHDYFMKFSSDKEYDASLDFIDMISESCRQYPPTGNGDDIVYKWTMRPVQPDSTMTLKMRKYFTEEEQTFTFALHENNRL